MELKEKIHNLVVSVLNEQGKRLVDLKIQGSYTRPAIEVFADSETGITLGECERITRIIRDELDMDGSFGADYRLSVSSPGLDRPLREDWEFKKNMGKTLTLRFQADGAEQRQEGSLINWDTEIIELKTKSGSVRIPRNQIEEAKIKLKW